MGIYLPVGAFFLYSVIICELILCKRIHLPSDSSGSSSLNDCQRCKILTESFNHWLEKTSRGKFEGGDAAWEESKLKSYARSEIRLVEVQEGLCSELKRHQDHCYSIAEEAEQALEKWWFQMDPNSVDLYTWLCIEILKYCCPSNHFGDSCSPCLLDISNKVCGGRGRCDGDGTRNGNGSCICKRGFTGQLCEDCAKNFYNADSGCEPCHKSCDGCSGEGATACHTCKSGWHLESGTCVDVNECSNPSICTSNQYCTNREGSYTCSACDKSCKTCTGSGSSDCTSCDSTSVLWSGICVDGELKKELVTNSLRRLVLYLGLILISFLIFRRFRTLASFIVLIIAVYIYYSEKSAKMNIVDVILKLYAK